MLFNDLSDKEFIKIANNHVEALNYALEAINPVKMLEFTFVGVIMKGRISRLLSMDNISFQLFMSVNANYLLFDIKSTSCS